LVVSRTAQVSATGKCQKTEHRQDRPYPKIALVIKQKWKFHVSRYCPEWLSDNRILLLAITVPDNRPRSHLDKGLAP
jgi:hypothetical protein